METEGQKRGGLKVFQRVPTLGEEAPSRLPLSPLTSDISLRSGKNCGRKEHSKALEWYINRYVCFPATN